MQKVTRRDFMGKGSAGLAALGVPGLSSALPAAASSQAPRLTDFYEMFGVDEALLRRIMGTALKKGGEYCDLYFQNRVHHFFSLQDRIVNNAGTMVDYGVGIRVLRGDQTGYSFTEEITPKTMALAAETAASIARSGKTAPPSALKWSPSPQYYPILTALEKIGSDRKVPFLTDIDRTVFALDKRIVKCGVSWSDDYNFILIADSEGRICCDYQPMTGLYVSCSAEQNGRQEQGAYNCSGRCGIEPYTPERIDFLAREAVRHTVMKFEAVKPEAGEMEIVLAPGSSGILLHEAIGHGLEADFNRKKISAFADQMGKKVAENFVTIVDDGTLPNFRGSINVDDEGNATGKTVLVENGILSSYMHDRISSRYFKVNPTGNGRRETFRFSPIPRMRTTYMPSGPHDPEEIVRSVKKGIYAEEFTNGQVSIGAGDFTFYVSLGCLIEDGRLTRPIKDVNIIGNGPEVLRRITMVGNDLKFSEGGWTCGKSGQGAPVQIGLPTVKISAITVGGLKSQEREGTGHE